MKQDAEHDTHKRPRQGFPDFLRDTFLQNLGLQSVAKTKVSELVFFAQSELEKGQSKVHLRVLLLHRLMGLRETSDNDEVVNGVEGVSFLLSVVQQLFPSWRYGSAFVKEFSATSISLPLDTVEYALERVFSDKKYGGEIPEALINIIRGSAKEVNQSKKKKVVTKASRPNQVILFQNLRMDK